MGAANQLAATTPVTFAGAANAATFSVGGFSQGSTTAAGVGMLTLAAGSTNDVINFGGAAAVASFASLTTNNATLTISGYLNNGGKSGGPDELIFGQDETSNLSKITFSGFGPRRKPISATASSRCSPRRQPSRNPPRCSVAP